MALNIVALPQEYIPDFNKDRPLFNAQIFVGEPDTDPEILINRKTVTLRQESGDTVDVPQPIRTSNGGVPTYNGSPAQILVDGNYSIKVLDRFGAQEYYYADYFKGLPLVEGDESRINHSLLSDLNAVGGHDAIYSREFNSVSDAVAGIDSSGSAISMTAMLGKTISVKNYYNNVTSGGSGILFFTVVAAGTGVADGGKFIDIDASVQLRQNLKYPVSVQAFGAPVGNVIDATQMFKNAIDYIKTLDEGLQSMPLHAPNGTYKLTDKSKS
jgi:hypothetical protein